MAPSMIGCERRVKRLISHAVKPRTDSTPPVEAGACASRSRSPQAAIRQTRAGLAVSAPGFFSICFQSALPLADFLAVYLFLLEHHPPEHNVRFSGGRRHLRCKRWLDQHPCKLVDGVARATRIIRA